MGMDREKKRWAAGLREAVSDCILNGKMTGSEIMAVVDGLLDVKKAEAKRVLA